MSFLYGATLKSLNNEGDEKNEGKHKIGNWIHLGDRVQPYAMEPDTERKMLGIQIMEKAWSI